MITVRLMGGLGNQMFQYAAALRLAIRHSTELKLDLSLLNRNNLWETHTKRNFSLDAYDLNSALSRHAVRMVPFKSRLTFVDRFSKLVRIGSNSANIYREKGVLFHPSVLNLPDDFVLEGYFQDERYFSDISDTVRDSFRAPLEAGHLKDETQKLAEDIRTCTSICVHVRRGDYVTNSLAAAHHGVCSINYYTNAIKALLEIVGADKIFVFSDDVPWCRSNFSQSPNLVVVGEKHSGYQSAIHLWLMSLSSHFVISNSTFGWWAAWLGSCPDKVVVRPSRWFQNERMMSGDICPASWARIDNTYVP
jgi:Glycosyl transferase family 11